MHIPPHLLLPQDKVLVRDKGDKITPASETIMHASDAKHAMDVEPDRYELVDHKRAAPHLKVVEKDETAHD